MAIIKKLLIVGQTPPPYHGQAIMIENTVNHEYNNLQVYHIRMNFSKGVDDIGKFSILKLIILFSLITKIIRYRFKYGVKNLYYPPAGPNSGPIFRDIIILGLTRIFFKKTIYHFRAGGVSEKLKTFPWPLRFIFNFIYSKPDLSIRLSAKNPDDGGYFKTKKDVIIPNGLKDNYISFPKSKTKSEVPVLLFVGVIKESKGVLDLLRACNILQNEGYTFALHLMGKPDSIEFEQKITTYIKENKLSEKVKFLGIKTGEDKWYEFAKSDIFCFPSFYECETFGNVLVEAMQYSLPIVATKWRGIPDIVKEEETGFLIKINQPKQLSITISKLLKDKVLQKKLGDAGRKRYEDNFKEKQYFENFEQHILKVIN